MPHPIFEQQPWFHHPAPVPGRLVGMLGKHEASLFYHLARDVFGGDGTIVDAGSFLGKSAYCLAQGLRENGRFDRERDRVHCFDDFLCHDDLSIGLIRDGFGEAPEIGRSTIACFERQVRPVRDLLEVHAGDFLTIEWTRRPIEILMVDIAKSAALGQRVIERFFADLLPGRSLVIHQDYHHPWLPHIHVAMEFLADSFELVAPKVDDSAVFALLRPIPAPALARVIANDFSDEEQLALMNRAIARLPAAARPMVELARVLLCRQLGRVDGLRDQFAGIEQRYPDAVATDWCSYFSQTRDLVDLTCGRHLFERGDFEAALTIADLVLARDIESNALELRASALLGLGRRDEADRTLDAARERPLINGHGRFALARILCSAGRSDDAEALLLRDLLDPALAVADRRMLCDGLCAIWDERPRPAHEDHVLDRLARELPGEREVDLLAARSRFRRGDRQGALQLMQAVVADGTCYDRCAELLRALGLTPEAVAAMRPQ